MALSRYSDLSTLKTIDEIEEEIFLLQKNLFDLKLKRATNQSVKSHLFKQTKRRIAQLKFKKASILKEKI